MAFISDRRKSIGFKHPQKGQPLIYLFNKIRVTYNAIILTLYV